MINWMGAGDGTPAELEIFHNVGRLFSGEDRPPITVAPSTTVAEALRLMLEHKYSMLPVVDDGELQGVFSLWTLAHLALSSASLPRLEELVIDDVMDSPLRVVTVDDRLDDVLSMVERDEAVLVGTRTSIEGVVTSWDVLDYFYTQTRAFVLIGEIELALRDIIARAVAADDLPNVIERAIKHNYDDGRPVPKILHELTVDDYRAIICNKENWVSFLGVLGKNRDVVNTKLKEVREIRNAVVHFRRGLSVAEYDYLARARGWLLERSRRIHGSSEKH